jgi:hypothetical protein
LESSVLVAIFSINCDLDIWVDIVSPLIRIRSTLDYPIALPEPSAQICSALATGRSLKIRDESCLGPNDSCGITYFLGLGGLCAQTIGVKSAIFQA